MRKRSKNTGPKVRPFTSMVAKQLAKQAVEAQEIKQPVALLPERCEEQDSDTMVQYEPFEHEKKSWLHYEPLKKLKLKASYEDLRSTYIRKMKALVHNAEILRQRFDNENYSEIARNRRVAEIIAFNSGFWANKDDCEYTQYQATGGKKWDPKGRLNWIRTVDKLNEKLGTTLTADDLYDYRRNESRESIGNYGPEFKANADAITAQYNKDLEFIDYINGIVRYKHERVKKAPKKQKRKIGERKISKADELVIAERNITCVVTSYKELYDVLPNHIKLLEQCVIHNDGTLEINMSEIPVIVIRSKHGLRIRNKKMPLVFILFGPKCTLALRGKYKDYAKKYTFYERIVKDNGYILTSEPQMHLVRYQDLSPASADYWMNNPDTRYFTNMDRELEEGEEKEKHNRSGVFEGTLYVRPNGQIRYKGVDGKMTEWEDDPAADAKDAKTCSTEEELKADKEIDFEV